MINPRVITCQPQSLHHIIPENPTAIVPLQNTPDQQTIVMAADIRELPLPREQIESLNPSRQAMLWILDSPSQFFNDLQEMATQQINDEIKDVRGKVFDIRADLDKRNPRAQVDGLSKALIKYHVARDSGENPALVQALSDKVDVLMASMKMSTNTSLFLQILKAGMAIRTPLLIQQLAIGGDAPELPGVSAKVGVQIQTVFPSLSLCQCLGNVQVNPETHIQAFAHFETGWSAPFGETIKAGAYVADIEHIGFDYRLSQNGEGMLPFSLDNLCIAFESVQRAEVNVSVKQPTDHVQFNEQLTFGADFVQQRLFDCTSSGMIAAGGHAAIQTASALVATGAVATVMSQVVVGTASIPLLFASAVGGCFLGGKMTSAMNFLPPTKVVNIAEGFTAGIDFGANSSKPVLDGLKVSMRNLDRLNASVVSVKDNTRNVYATANDREVMTISTQSDGGPEAVLDIREATEDFEMRSIHDDSEESPESMESMEAQETPETVLRQRVTQELSVNSAYSSMRSRANSRSDNTKL
ncbi:hypothetical protein QN360_16170 [Glaciimonas sp. CA11.2]|uniref:hypothetical protein n=1 Tax=Glaciimonas sp. CA11.2 TaxID=3048601 RepID=UPI002AB39F5C|nr:hypothetical protein [Glaciimonas sp. CA11.2]MDY7544928.1 hypothetical protein [Glaciimonas sp. CA11.2]MEB0164431.1 hypothetical protein [Glaciimonas sp. CA11.2]